MVDKHIWMNMKLQHETKQCKRKNAGVVFGTKFYIVQSPRYIPLATTWCALSSKIVCCSVLLMKVPVHKNWTKTHCGDCNSHYPSQQASYIRCMCLTTIYFNHGIFSRTSIKCMHLTTRVNGNYCYKNAKVGIFSQSNTIIHLLFRYFMLLGSLNF